MGSKSSLQEECRPRRGQGQSLRAGAGSGLDGFAQESVSHLGSQSGTQNVMHYTETRANNTFSVPNGKQNEPEMNCVLVKGY